MKSPDAKTETTTLLDNNASLVDLFRLYVNLLHKREIYKQLAAFISGYLRTDFGTGEPEKKMYIDCEFAPVVGIDALIQVRNELMQAIEKLDAELTLFEQNSLGNRARAKKGRTVSNIIK